VQAVELVHLRLETGRAHVAGEEPCVDDGVTGHEADDAVGSEAGERLGVGERARDGRGVRGQGADLEVALPGGVGGQDAVDVAEDEAEAVVVGGTAEQGDKGLGEGVGSPEDGVHEGTADTTGVVVGMDAKGPETKHRRGVDVGTGADDVADDGVGGVDGHERKRW
jgi:hypothetical protein